MDGLPALELGDVRQSLFVRLDHFLYDRFRRAVFGVRGFTVSGIGFRI